jgi:hypothetical protein
MLLIVSDIHLADGTCGRSISPAAVNLFVGRLAEMAHNASIHRDGKVHPVEKIDILLMGDILDPLHSTLWLEKNAGEQGYVRPWTDHRHPDFSSKLREITRAILKNNQETISIFKWLAHAGLELPPMSAGSQKPGSRKENPIKVNLHYMVGNHDWYYHLPGREFDNLRDEIIDAFGLSNRRDLFPHELKESLELSSLLNEYKVYAQHGDLYDSFNYDKTTGRDGSSIGDAFAVEIVNRFPLEVAYQMGEALPSDFLNSLRELVNIRPAFAAPLWISGQLRQNKISDPDQNKIKKIWDTICDDFLELDLARKKDIPFKLDAMDGIEMAVQLTDMVSFKTIDSLVVWLRKKLGSGDFSFAHYALKEEAFLDRKAQFIVYGHTHHYEVVPLDSFQGFQRSTSQMYINSGTWHTYFDLAINKPEEQKFIPYQVLTYVSFYKDEEFQGRRFETWSGSFSD